MVERLTGSLVRKMISQNLIDEESQCEYEYVITCTIEKWFTIISIMLLSILFNNILETIVFLIFFYELRKHTGGYHASTYGRCYIMSLGSYMVISYLGSRLSATNLIFLSVYLLSFVLIMVIGTVNNPSIHMDSKELKISKRFSRIIVSLEIGVTVICIVCGIHESIIVYMQLAICMCAFSFVLIIMKGEMLNEVNNTETYQEDSRKTS